MDPDGPPLSSGLAGHPLNMRGYFRVTRPVGVPYIQGHRPGCMDIEGAAPSGSTLPHPVRGQSLPYSRIILTDLEAPAQDTHNEKSVELFEEVKTNLATLLSGGAQGPHYGISGFRLPSALCLNGGRISGVVDYASMAEGLGFKVGVAYWGSPDWSHNCIPRYFDHDPIPHTTASDDFKTNAWESMRWLSRDCFNCITFSPKDKVEFYPPQWKRQDCGEDFPTGRQLIVGEGYFRQYVPLMSGGLRHPVSWKREPTFVAMLVPTRFRECLHYTQERLDFGKTCLAVLNKLAPTEVAIELGGQTFSLTFEIHLAKMEQEQSASSQQF